MQSSRSHSSVKSTAGFTLIELSIVLIIIGLIIGGVLVGKQMMMVANVRSSVSQIQQINSAINVFRDRYRSIPGDVSSSMAAFIGLQTRAGTAGHGDNNGLIEFCGATNTTDAGCENMLFWRDLATINLMTGHFTAATDTAAVSLTGQDFPNYLPPAKLSGSYILAFGSTVDHQNYFEITSVLATDNAGVYTLQPSIAPIQAYNIDQKMDDGLPNMGLVRGMKGTAPDTAANYGAGDACVASASLYATITAPDEPACQLRIKMGY